MGGFQPWHLLVIALVGAFLFFGWKNLPDMARSFGRSLRVFKTEIKGMTDDDSARDKADKARDENKDAAPKQLEPRPTPVQRAQVVPPRATVEKATAGARPRPTPSPNGRPRT